MLDVGVELHIFFSAVWTGVVVCLVYQLLGLFEQLLRMKKWMINFIDGIYWVWTSVYVYMRIFDTTKGVMRWYFFLGIVVGIFTMHTIWCSAKKVVLFIRKKLAKE